ncbi:MAG: hypothetical protein ACLPY5_03985 [Candidatus Bathyarchaeia archaeon]
MSGFEASESIPMDREHMLDQSTGRFQSVKDGLPELIKNSKDQYSRLRVLDKDKRKIIILISSDMTKLGVLDFAGARAEQFEQWQVWSSRDASRADLAEDIEGAHGNGGKSFMVRGSTRQSYLCSVFEDKMSKMGFKNDDPALKYRPGKYSSGGHSIFKLPCSDIESVLDSELAQFDNSINNLPDDAKQIFRERRSFTLVLVDGVREWAGLSRRALENLIHRVPEDLQIHPQTALTIESCSVTVVRGDTPIGNDPLQVIEPEPYPGFENLPRIPIPDRLPDPNTDEPIKTGRGGPEEKYLEIRTSAQGLRLSVRTKPKNVLRVRNERNIVASYSMAELVPMSTSGFLYGTLRMPAITDQHLSGIERQNLADTPLVRALISWASDRLKEIADQIQRAQSNRESPLEREHANDTLSKLRELMRKFLNPEVGSGGVGIGPNPPPIEFGNNVDEIQLETEGKTLRFPLGTTIPLAYNAYEVRNERKLPVHSPDLQLETDHPDIVTLVGRSSLTGLRPGVCELRLMTWDSRVKSNPIKIEVIEIEQLQIDSPVGALKQGERRKINIVAHGRNGSTFDDLVYETAVDELEMGRISRSGFFTAGRIAGSATIRIRFGPDARDNETCRVEISDERIDSDKSKRQSGGPDIPYLVLCGQPAPGYEHLSEDQRTVQGGPELPTIIDQDPLWPNIVWINHCSKESEKVRGRARTGGRRGLDTTTFQQFLALKAFEVLRRLKVVQEIGDERATSVEFLQYLAEAEMGTVDFLDAAYDLIDRILEGQKAE